MGAGTGGDLPEYQRVERERADRLRRDREQTALELAVDAARREERVQLRLQNHDQAIKELQHGQATIEATLNGLKTQLNRLEKTVEQSAAVASAMADHAKEMAESAASNVSTRSFYVGVLILVVAIAGLFLGSKP